MTSNSASPVDLPVLWLFEAAEFAVAVYQLWQIIYAVSKDERVSWASSPGHHVPMVLLSRYVDPCSYIQGFSNTASGFQQ